MKRLEKEVRTVGLMIGLYCRHHHGGKELCVNCRELAAYAEGRIGKCPFGEEKPACNRCPIHCYKPEMKARIKEVMWFAGPRMTWRHPLLAIPHLFGRRSRVAHR
jgi:Nitrous oxide-stimulated promoter